MDATKDMADLLTMSPFPGVRVAASPAVVFTGRRGILPVRREKQIGRTPERIGKFPQ